MESTRYELVLAPLDDPIVANRGRAGARLAPDAIMGTLNEFAFAPEGPIVARHRLALTNERARVRDEHALIEQTVAGIVASGRVPLVLGGDNSISYATVRGTRRGSAPVGVLYLDAHFDMRPVVDGLITSGCPFWRLLEEGTLLAAHTAPIGIEEPRDLADAARKDYHPLEEYARKKGVPFVTRREVAARGMEPVVREALSRMPERFVLSIDMDCLDESVAPGVSSRAAGRLTLAEVETAIDLAGPRASSFELVEVSPPLDPSGGTVAVAARLVERFLSAAAWRG